MYKGRGLAAGFLFLVLSCWCAASDPNTHAAPAVSDPCDLSPKIQKWTVWHFWQMLQPAMSKEVVLEMLGEPLEKESTDIACIWYYQELPVRLENGVIQRPKFGFLNFTKTTAGGQEKMLLKLWKQPDWNQVRGYSAQEYQMELDRIEQLKKEQLERQRKLEEQKRLEEERRKREEALRQQQIEQQRQLRAQQAAAERNRGFSLEDIPQTYWYAGGGILIGLVIAFILIKKPFSG